MKNMPVPYSGKEKYIFVSYSHKDSDKVLPVIVRMKAQGYRVWFDQGIDPGSEWDENIAQHINNCGYFAAFMSDNYLASGNCCDELSYARDLDKDRLVVYLEYVDLPSGIAMRINRIQSIYMYKYTDSEMFFEKLFSTQNLDSCADLQPTVVVDQPVSHTAYAQNTNSVEPAHTTQTSSEVESAKKQEAISNRKPQPVTAPKGKKTSGMVTFIIAVVLFTLSLIFIDVPAVGFVFSLFSTVASLLTFTGVLDKKPLRIINHVVFAVNLFLGITFAGMGLGNIAAVYYAILGIIVLTPLWIMFSIKKYKK
ncbi:MAG: TIR domain-containing protein [Ruminococcus sp.]|nr:TIR domain-containing protein [Ruminococcus sp.]